MSLLLKPSKLAAFNSLAGISIICLAQGDWGPPLQTVHQLMTRLARHMRVLYVEPPLADPRMRFNSLANKMINWRDSPIQVNENLYVCHTPPGLPLKRAFPLMGRLTSAYIAPLIARRVEQLGMSERLLWLTWPTQAELLGTLDECMVVYHIADDFTYMPLGRRSVVDELERRILTRADLVIASSQQTYDARKHLTKNIYLIPNGVDYEHFSRVLYSTNPVPQDLADLPRPIIGFSGCMDHRLDVNLLAKLAKRFSNGSIVLVGPKYTGVGELEHLSNVHYLGMKTIEALPSYLAAFDVCLIPYKITDYTKALSPLKLLEYFSLGKPVVTTPIPSCIIYSDILYVGEDHESFFVQVDSALAENDAQLRELRMKVANENTWDNRVLFILEKIAEIYSSR